ncbi:hypothetical protein [Fructobacillus americanaquae]|uniref:Uncharacterized protein n=1 Tax=Fructobacillus americanaquae TaxID=2940302 RepID=A0ABY5BYY3_9LACO|nr:hypothetical protein [Fructobacillus americanaquae]USS91557.1 hypothetical protein M3M36_04290 [Fructobacillus americanaquae]
MNMNIGGLVYKKDLMSPTHEVFLFVLKPDYLAERELGSLLMATTPPKKPWDKNLSFRLANVSIYSNIFQHFTLAILSIIMQYFAVIVMMNELDTVRTSPI